MKLQELLNDKFRNIDKETDQKYTQFLLDDCSSDLTLANGGVNFGKIKGIHSGDKKNTKEILLGGMVPKNSKALAVTKMHYSTKFKVIVHAWYQDYSFLRLKADGMRVLSNTTNSNYVKIVKIPSIPSSNQICSDLYVLIPKAGFQLPYEEMYDSIDREINQVALNQQGVFAGHSLERIWLPEMNIEFAQKWKAKKDDKAKKVEPVGELQMIENTLIKDYKFGDLE